MVTNSEPLYDPCGGDLSLDFVNGNGRNGAGVTGEWLDEYATLTRWSVEAGSLPASRARTLNGMGLEQSGRSRAVLKRARELREAIFETFRPRPRTKRSSAAALGIINRELSSAMAHACLERGSTGYRMAWCGEAEALDSPLWPIARAAADLLISPERERVRACACEDCLWLFVDRTRNRARRWCDMKSCGNRAKVREHRRRRRGTKLSLSGR